MCPSFLLSYIHCHCCCYYPKIFVGRKTFTFSSQLPAFIFIAIVIANTIAPQKNPGRETLACPSLLPAFKAKAGLPLPPVQWRSFICFFLFLYLGICILIAFGKLYRGHGNSFWYLWVFLVSLVLWAAKKGWKWPLLLFSIQTLKYIAIGQSEVAVYSACRDVQ